MTRSEAVKILKEELLSEPGCGCNYCQALSLTIQVLEGEEKLKAELAETKRIWHIAESCMYDKEGRLLDANTELAEAKKEIEALHRDIDIICADSATLVENMPSDFRYDIIRDVFTNSMGDIYKKGEKL